VTDDRGFVELFDATVRRDGGRVFARYDGVPLTFAALDRKAGALATALRRKGLRPGDRIATMLRNGPAALALMFGLARAGLVWVPINVQQRGEGLRYVLEHSSPHLVIAEHDLVSGMRSLGIELPPVVISGAEAGDERLETLLEGEAAFGGQPPSPDACFAILYTSGTTGPPKGVLLSHQMLRLAGEAVALVSAARDGDTFLVWEPLYHIGGAQLILLPLIRRVVLAMVDRFSASSFWRQVRAEEATHIHFLGGILQILLKQPPGPLDRGHGVRVAWGGGCPKPIWRPFEERFGIEIRECYGMTEASSITTYNDTRTIGSVGKPVPWFAVELRDADDRPVGVGARGQIVVRPHRDDALFAGYFRNEEATAKALRGGALYTGDLGVFDADGNLAFLGRMTDSVRCRGENVSAWEVERVASSHPAVADCAMIGVDAEIGEQEIKLFVEPKPGASLDLAALSDWLGERLAPYQNPRYLAVVEAFERTPSQRIMKHTLPRTVEGSWDRLAHRKERARV
jgi:crotonobetaine/carnitine-CoA ligase